VRHAFWLRGDPWDLVVLVDFGAYNLRLARTLRRLGYTRPILYFFPPGAWFDKPKQARAVAKYTTPLTPFEHQRAFYASLGLGVVSFGHPLASLVAPRAPRPPAPPDGGVVAILPGSRAGEIERHMPVLIAACKVLRARRPRVRFVVAAADADGEARIDAELERAFLPPFIVGAPFDELGVTGPPGGRESMAAGASAGTGFDVVRGARAALDEADAAWIASGTAVLEAALREVPAVALYIVSDAQVAIARRIWKRPYITLPNILLGRAVVPECLQEGATPERLANELESALADPAPRLAGLHEVRSALGDDRALERSASFALELARV
jgi:lipid-A-disaccharide synthase